ncbi:MAG TPA: 3-hydroxybutyryl-CoA dehydrogenase [Candidatus Dormibacteraeota bacterium]|nr:3-hydroxybutyryl-CoA dehydrogenase [Candidatus Dormibacteraeota bacterium]
MNLDAIKIAGVVGAGTMGNGIAHVFARGGYQVILCDVEQSRLDRALATISKNLDREIKRDKLAEADKPAVLARIHPATGFEALGAAEIVVEAVPEQPALKRQVISELGRLLDPKVVIASNTSSISITALGASSGRPDRFIGMHFMNPVPVMTLVEVVRGLATSEETVALVLGLCERLGKTPVAASDAPGFVSNRVLMPMLNEAMYAVLEGVATVQAVDQVMKLGMNHPLGPLELSDLIGLDVCLDIMEVMHRGLGDSKYRPCPLLRNMVAAGWLGRKTGCGFYVYEGGTASPNPALGVGAVRR